MEYVSMLILGVVLCGLGILNLKGNISLIHRYNRKRVREEDVPAYGKAVGIGHVIIGGSFALCFFLSFVSELILPFVIVPSIAAGLGFILYAQFKYNGGLF